MPPFESFLDPTRLATLSNIQRAQRPFALSMGFSVECKDRGSEFIPQGQRIKHPDHPEIWFLDEGKRRLIPSDATHSNLFFDFEFILEVAELEKIPEGRPLDEDAILARPSNQDPVYLIDGGMKRHVSNPRVMARYHLNYFRVYEVPPILLRTIPDGPPLN